MILFLIIMIIPSFLSKQIKLRTLILDSEIFIEINGTGNQRILSEEAEIPTYMELNGSSITPTKILYNLSEQYNTIKMKWNTSLSICNSMFKELRSITKINLTNFDSSQVTDMSNMFRACSSLKSIDFSNIDTKSVTDFGYMFYECGSLISLDLRNFDTSSAKAMNQMFFVCANLKTLDLSIFNTSLVTNMAQMFYGCFALISLELVNFNTSSVTTMNQMFYYCK